MSTPPDSARCRTALRDGTVLTVTATRRPRANRAEVKCIVPGAPALAERMTEVVRLARLTEARWDSRDQVVLSIDGTPGLAERDWELAAVLADRLVRGAWRAPQDPVALGWSDAWQLGRVDGHDARILPPGPLLLGGPRPGGEADMDYLPHLGALTGHADPSAAVSSVRAWFPLHSGGINDSLAWVDVAVFPRDAADAADEEDSIAVPGADAVLQAAVRAALAGARHFDGRGSGRWRTVVRFSQARFQGDSYGLALVMADRLARGRDFVPRGRLIATGTSDAWHAGTVAGVEGLAAKTAFILAQAAPGDRVLLPAAWQDELPAGFADALRGRGASLACIDRIGLI
ncbi:hypothetical protein ACFFTM_14490 [Pseudoduganella plicata]|uniref:Uncharacterized protein n=1 Tax=Pseudoduganella plicata TaxID=321984 RepID=A0A4P7B9Y9_9BURK|nr:hypothetical protein [Pseudoduganella plicata]QBQ34880.1 hypothetical protein E1742_00775 [Pseudoduganella plicata]GGY89276.1 hypothetical protein GCM10007388_23450 [Pseudoduganella plicata]